MGQWMDRWVGQLYERLGARYLVVLRLLVVGVVASTYIGMLALYLAFYTDATGEQWLRAVVVAVALTALIAVTWLLPRFRRAHRPIELWLTGQRSPEQVQAAWEQSKRIAVDDLVTGVTGASALIPFSAYLAWEFDLGAVELLTVFLWLVIIVTFLSAILIPFIELYGRPFRLELARSILAADASPRVSFGNWVLASLVAVSLTTGTAVAFVANPGDLVRLGQLTVFAVVITATTSGVVAVMLQRSVMAPMEDLLEVTDQVQAGNRGVRAPVTTDDEVGRLAASVNRMLDSLEHSEAEVRASRERIVAASDQERQRVERNIHDGAQQQLVTLMLRLRGVREVVGDDPRVAAELDGSLAALETALEELRELAQGLHPSVLITDGLGPALEQLADRATLPVTVAVDGHRWSEMIESTAWFVASEALANVSKYAQASQASVSAAHQDGHLVVEVVDDGIGGATLDKGSGLRGLADRVEAVGGTLTVDSPAGRGTTLIAHLPVTDVMSD